MNNLNKLYNDNLNIMDYFRKKDNTNVNSIDAILVSYDLQAGSYREDYYDGISDGMHRGGNKISMKSQKFKEEYGKSIADIFNKLKYSSVLEVGVGEATTLCDVVKNLNNKQTDIKGIDISVSRIGYGNVFIKEQGMNNVTLGVADMFNLPFKDNAFDIVYTSHCIEPNTDRAKEAVNELYRITNKYLVLIEPSYDLGNEETRKHMVEHSYCVDLINVITDMRLNIKEHKLFKIGTYNNQAAITIIEKRVYNESNSNWCCPICKKELIENEGNYFCKNCYLIFPVIKKIPCLTVDAGILGSKYLEF